MHKLRWLVLGMHPHRVVVAEKVVSVLVLFVLFSGQTSAVIRLGNRSLMINNSTPGITTSYTVSFKFTSTAPIGSIDMLFCVDPIPYLACIPPDGLNTSNAALANQTGDTGFNITTRTANHLVLSRPSAEAVSNEQSNYTFTGIVNPTAAATDHSYSVRLSTHANTNGTGPVIDLGSVVTQVTDVVTLQTQVPPMLIFCMAETVSMDCTESSDIRYNDMGELNPDQTLTAQSQMAVGTNASGGFVITASGTPLAAGARTITSPSTPTFSAPGNNQFGMNVVENSFIGVGKDPDGPSINAIAAPGYNQPNKFMYRSGDVIASSPNVSLMRRFTTTYIANIRPDLTAGTYTTTISYICSGRF